MFYASVSARPAAAGLIDRKQVDAAHKG
jgi:hypothetical protein